MPGMRCAIGLCTNAKSRNTSDKSGQQISFYRFPKNERIRKLWVQRCRRADKWNPDNSRVCSEHFTEDDFQRDLQAELLNMPTKRKLKDTAIPSLKLSKSHVETASPGKLERRRRFAERTRKSLVNDILARENENHEGSAVIVKTEDGIWSLAILQSESSHMIEKNEYESSAFIVKSEIEVCSPSISQSESSPMIEENTYESSADIVKTENGVCLPSISQSESLRMIEESGYESSAVIVKTEDEDCLPSASQSESSHMIEENIHEGSADIVKTESEICLPPVSHSESSHMFEENRYESSAVIVKTEDEVCLPSTSPFDSSNMIEENKHQSSAVVVENVVWLPSLSQSSSLQLIEEECGSNSVTTGNAAWLPPMSRSESSQTMEAKYESLLKKYESVVKENEEIKRQMRLSHEVTKENKEQLRRLKKDLEDLKKKFSSETAYRIQLENSIKHLLSKAQQDVVLRKRKKVRWSSEDISNALAIRNISKKCYIYLRKKLKYPLPDLSSLQRYATKLNVQQTISTDHKDNDTR